MTDWTFLLPLAEMLDPRCLRLLASLAVPPAAVAGGVLGLALLGAAAATDRPARR